MPSDLGANLSVEVYGWESALRLFDSVRLNTAETRRLFKDLGAEMVRIGEEISPVDPVRQYDSRRRPLSESFSKQWVFDVVEERSGGSVATTESLELQVGNTDERKGWIIEGTPPRSIPKSVTAQQAKGQPLYFWWDDGPEGPDFYEKWEIRGGVAAKGTEPHPVPDEILREVNLSSILHLLSMRIIK